MKFITHLNNKKTMPQYSIIIATLNAAATLEHALESVLSQSCRDFELIVQDGASTDGTLNLLQARAPKLDWQSSPDCGVYDAWNKAVERANGEWALFLGADDRLLSRHTLAQCRRHLSALPRRVQFAFGALWQGRGGQAQGLINRSAHEVYHMFFRNMGLPFPATFIRLPLLKKHKFDPSYKIAGDYDLAARLLNHDNMVRLPIQVSYMERGGISETGLAGMTPQEEALRVLFTRVIPRAGEFALGCAGNLHQARYDLEQILI
ncbi:MAG: glycosyltransferase [Deltaproteobacteria bacterium]|nr:glycosyltransferase [Deltaproteobacteria bacterium]